MSDGESDEDMYYDAIDDHLQPEPMDHTPPFSSTPVRHHPAAIFPQHTSEGDKVINISSSEVNIQQTITVQGSSFSGSTASFGVHSQDGLAAQREDSLPSQDCSITMKPHPLSLKFSKLCVRVARCFDTPRQLDELKVMVSAWNTGDFKQMVMASVSSLSSVYQLIATGNEKCWWNWLDYANLIYLVDNMYCEHASKCLEEYDQELKTFCEKRLDSLISVKKSLSSSYDRSHRVNAFLKVKWEGEAKSFKLGNLYQAKDFLIDHLKISPGAFVFHDVCPGCLCLQWALLGASVCKAIKEKLSTYQFPIPFAGGIITAIEVVYPKYCLGSKETFMYGKDEFEIFSQVSDHSKCPICFGIIQDTVITACCQESFCTVCIIAALKHSTLCPICRKDDYKYETSKFVDRKIIGNLQGRCFKCKWEGDLFNSRSHSCPSGESCDTSDTDLKPQSEHIAQAMSPATDVNEIRVEDADCSGMIEDASSIASDKDPFLDQLQHLREGIQSLQALLPGSQQRPVSRDSGSDDVGAFRDALNTVGALLEQVEEHFHGYAASVTSDADSKLSDVEGEEKALMPVDRPASQEEVKPVTSTVVASRTPGDIISPQFPVPQPVQPKGDSTEPQTEASQPAKEVHPDVKASGTDREMHAFLEEARRMVYVAAAAGQHAVLEQLISFSGVNIESLSDVNDVYGYALHYGHKGRSPLHLAARNGHVETVKMLLSHDTSVALRTDQLGSTPLHEAASSGSLGCLSAILEHNPDVNAANRREQTPLLVASSKGHTAVVEKLIICGASVACLDSMAQSALHLAVLSANISTVNCLLEAGLSPNEANQKGMTPLHLAASKGFTEIAAALINRKANLLTNSRKGMTPLMYAVSSGHVDTAKRLAESGADVDKRDGRGRGLLHLAVLSRSCPMVESLVSLGCNVSDVAATDLQGIPSSPRQRHRHAGLASLSAYDYHDDDEDDLPQPYIRVISSAPKPESDTGIHDPDALPVSCTPFQLAVVLGEEKIIEFFMLRDVDLDIKTKEGYGLLHLTAWKGHSDLTRKFISLGCDPNITTEEGVSPLHLASKFGRADVATALIEGGCDVDGHASRKIGKQTSFKLTPFLTAAMQLESGSIMRLLISSGCDVNAVTDDGSNAFHLTVTKALSDLQGRRQEPFYHNRRGSDQISYKFETSAQTLKQAGCNINKLNSAGLAPLDLVEMSSNTVLGSLDSASDLEYFAIDRLHHRIRSGRRHRSHLQSELPSILMHLGAKTAGEIKREEQLSKQLKSVSSSSNQVHHMYRAKQSSIKLLQERGPFSTRGRFARNTPSMYQISSLVVPQISSLWEEIGKQLELPSELVEQVRLESRDSHERCLLLFKKWLEGEGVQPKTWQVLLDALEAIGKESLSHSIRSNLQQLRI